MLRATEPESPTMPRRALLPALAVSLLLAACSSHPDLATRETALSKSAPYPALAPLAPLLAAADAPSRAKPAETQLTARAAGLRARAAALRAGR